MCEHAQLWPPQLLPFWGDPGPHLIHGSFGPHPKRNLNGSAQLTAVPNNMHSNILCFTVLSNGPNPKSTPFPCGIRAPLWYMVPWEHLRPFTNATSLNSATTTVSDRHIHKHTDSTLTGKVTITRQGIYFKIILISNSLTHTHTPV